MIQGQGLVKLLQGMEATIFSFFAWRLTGCAAVQQHRLAQGSAGCALVHQAAAEACPPASAKSKTCCWSELTEDSSPSGLPRGLCRGLQRGLGCMLRFP